MVKIDIGKITNTDRSLLPQFARPKAPAWTTRVSRFPRTLLWPLLLLLLCLQGLASWRIFFYTPALPPRSPYNMAETVGLVSKWYELLQEMKYLGPDAVAYPPHTGEQAVNVTLAMHLGLDKRVIETMQHLPYVVAEPSGWMPSSQTILWRDGHFVDYRTDADIWGSRDPLLRWTISMSRDTIFETAMEEMEALPLTAIPLSIIRARGFTKYGLVLILDVASNTIIVQDTQGAGGRNGDPFFKKFAWNEIPREYKIPGWFYGQDGLYGRV